jgi:putative transposase
MDFVSDTFGASFKFRTLAVNDDCCRENLCLAGDASISGACVAREIDSLADARRKLAIWRYDYKDIRPHASLCKRMSRRI